MAMQAATVEILIEKAKFEPRVAVAIAEAMDEALEGKARQLQLVTLPMLDERLTAVREKLEDKSDDIADKFEGRMGAFEHRLEGKFSAFVDKVEARFDRLENKVGGLQGEIRELDVKGQSNKADLVRFVLLAIMSQFAMITGMMYFLLQQLR